MADGVKHESDSTGEGGEEKHGGVQVQKEPNMVKLFETIPVPGELSDFWSKLTFKVVQPDIFERDFELSQFGSEVAVTPRVLGVEVPSDEIVQMDEAVRIGTMEQKEADIWMSVGPLFSFSHVNEVEKTWSSGHLPFSGSVENPEEGEGRIQDLSLMISHDLYALGRTEELHFRRFPMRNGAAGLREQSFTLPGLPADRRRNELGGYFSPRVLSALEDRWAGNSLIQDYEVVYAVIDKVGGLDIDLPESAMVRGDRVKHIIPGVPLYYDVDNPWAMSKVVSDAMPYTALGAKLAKMGMAEARFDFSPSTWVIPGHSLKSMPTIRGLALMSGANFFTNMTSAQEAALFIEALAKVAGGGFGVRIEFAGIPKGEGINGIGVLQALWNLYYIPVDWIDPVALDEMLDMVAIAVRGASVAGEARKVIESAVRIENSKDPSNVLALVKELMASSLWAEVSTPFGHVETWSGRRWGIGAFIPTAGGSYLSPDTYRYSEPIMRQMGAALDKRSDQVWEWFRGFISENTKIDACPPRLTALFYLTVMNARARFGLGCRQPSSPFAKISIAFSGAMSFQLRGAETPVSKSAHVPWPLTNVVEEMSRYNLLEICVCLVQFVIDTIPQRDESFTRLDFAIKLWSVVFNEAPQVEFLREMINAFEIRKGLKMPNRAAFFNKYLKRKISPYARFWDETLHYRVFCPVKELPFGQEILVYPSHRGSLADEVKDDTLRQMYGKPNLLQLLNYIRNDHMSGTISTHVELTGVRLRPLPVRVTPILKPKLGSVVLPVVKEVPFDVPRAQTVVPMEIPFLKKRRGHVFPSLEVVGVHGPPPISRVVFATQDTTLQVVAAECPDNHPVLSDSLWAVSEGWPSDHRELCRYVRILWDEVEYAPFVARFVQVRM